MPRCELHAFGTPIPKEHQANIDKYTPVFMDKLEAAARAARKDLKPAKLEWGVGKVGFAINCLHGEGWPDRPRSARAVCKGRKGHGPRGVPQLRLPLRYALAATRWAADWAGFAASAIEDNFADAVALSSPSAGADQNSVFRRHRGEGRVATHRDADRSRGAAV